MQEDDHGNLVNGRREFLKKGGKITHDPGERISWTNRPPVSVVMDTDEDHKIVTETDPVKRAELIHDTAMAKRNRMKAVCSHCHQPSKTKRSLLK